MRATLTACDVSGWRSPRRVSSTPTSSRGPATMSHVRSAPPRDAHAAPSASQPNRIFTRAPLDRFPLRSQRYPGGETFKPATVGPALNRTPDGDPRSPTQALPYRLPPPW